MLIKDEKIFEALVQKTAEFKHIPENAVIRDYLICKILLKLSRSEYKARCIFKGGTSLSKCYPNTIERFSEDIDLTYLPSNDESEKSITKNLKALENLLSLEFKSEKIERERSNRNKSSYVHDPLLGAEYRIKLEIGSSVRPEPYSLLSVKTYFQEFLEKIKEETSANILRELELETFYVNTLNIERTFMDKVFAIKRHTLEGNIKNKARHLYDVKKLWEHEEVKRFLDQSERVKALVQLIKKTDAIYLTGKRECSRYRPKENFDYNLWKDELAIKELRKSYEFLHKELLYTDEKQKFEDALAVMEQVADIFIKIKE